MNTEQDLIPFSCSPLPKSPWLVFVPHPDDETFGMGGSLLRAREENIDVTLVIMTDGALGSAEEKQSLVDIRKSEINAVAQQINAKKVVFLDQPDRGLTLHPNTIEILASLIDSMPNASVFFPSMQEPHPDHRVTAELVWHALKRSDQFAGQAFAYDISVQGQVNYYIDTSSVVEEKRALMMLYPSQLSENRYIQVVEGLDRARSYTLGQQVTAAEGFYLYQDLNTSLINQLNARIMLLAVDKSEHELETIKRAYESEIQQLRETLQAILQSTSWRITKPLRALKETFSKSK